MPDKIDQEKCKKCKLCIEVCPNSIFGTNPNNEVIIIPERKSICFKCGHCMAICPAQAIFVDDLTYEHDLFDLPENNVNYHELMNFLYSRRSVRNFKDTPVPKDILEKIVDSIAAAPFGCAPEKVHITVIDNREIISSALPKISEFYDKITKWIPNPLIRFMIKHEKGQETLNTLRHHVYPIAKAGNYKLENGDRITRNTQALLIFHAEKGAEEHTNNSLIFATYTILAAHSLGLGAAMIGLVPAAINKVREVRKIFQIPENHEAIISVILGYPKYTFKRTIKRKPLPVKWL
jgi:nitroreductase/NAD-dependent dihydropyrimidine dehydrogenase PreA subunit